MKMKHLVMGLVLAAGFSASANLGELAEYKNGILKIKMDTCGGQVSPVVTFKALEEIVDPNLSYGLYRATISKSAEITPDTICPFNAPTVFELDLTKLLKEWSESKGGSLKARALFEKGGVINITVAPFSTGINFQTRVEKP